MTDSNAGDSSCHSPGDFRSDFRGDFRGDKWAIDGKFAGPEEHAELLVIGAGAAGLAAAIEAARLGVRVVLVDENPVPLSLMGLDVPLFYGQQMNAAVQEEARMIERLVAADPAIAAAFDAGVDVRLGVTAWGAFAPGPGSQALPGRAAGLSDGRRSWLCGFDMLVLATGARDLVLGFDGIDLPGVMGARALDSLLRRYDAFDGKHLVILGSGPLAAETAIAALDRGLAVRALVEVMDAPLMAPDRVAALADRGVAILTGTAILRAEPGFARVSGLLVARADAGGAPARLDCDTVCLAIGAVPAIELAGVLGCALAYRGELGGHVPVLSSAGETSLPGIFCVGDCAGIQAGDDGQEAARQVALRAAARLRCRPEPPIQAASVPVEDASDYRRGWMAALLATGAPATPVCLCEEVSRAEFLSVQPPRYLGPVPDRQAARNGATLAADGRPHPDQLKRLTRAGMGVCQGRRCREQIALMLALTADLPLAAIPLASYRAPVRPSPLSVLADGAESTAMRAGWDVWFGIRTQWVPYDIIGTDAEREFLAAGSGGNMHA